MTSTYLATAAGALTGIALGELIAWSWRRRRDRR